MRFDLWNSQAPSPPLQIDSLPQRTVAIDLSPCRPAERLGLRKGEQSISPWRDDDVRTEAFQSKNSGWWLPPAAAGATDHHPVGSIDYGFFDHKTAYQRPRTRTTTRTRTIREAGGSKQESHPVIPYSHAVYIQF